MSLKQTAVNCNLQLCSIISHEKIIKSYKGQLYVVRQQKERQK